MKKYIIVLLLISFNLLAQNPDGAIFSLSPKGFVCSWLIKGPFPTDNGKLRDKDYLTSDGGEEKIFSITDIAKEINRSGNSADDNKWFPVYSNSYIVSFLNYYKITDKVLAYGLSFIESDKDQKVLLKLGSDDGVKLFLNSKMIHNNPVMRGTTIDADIVPAELKKGINPILIKIDQGGGDWGFCLRILGDNDEPIKNLRSVIPFKFSDDLVLKTVLSSFNLYTTLDKSFSYNSKKANVFPEAKFVILIKSEMSFPKDFDSSLKVKILFLNNSSQLIEEFYKTEINSVSDFSTKEIIYTPKNIPPGQYVIRLVILDKNDNEISNKENIVFWD